jgi:hypothetical protein
MDHGRWHTIASPDPGNAGSYLYGVLDNRAGTLQPASPVPRRAPATSGARSKNIPHPAPLTRAVAWTLSGPAEPACRGLNETAPYAISPESSCGFNVNLA